MGGHGPTPHVKLPTREVNDRLVDNERECPSCEGTLEEMGEHTADTRQISVEKRRFFVDRHVRHKYRCRHNRAIQTAPGPLRLSKGGHHSIDCAIDREIDRRINHPPLDRQHRQMERGSPSCLCCEPASSSRSTVVGTALDVPALSAYVSYVSFGISATGWGRLAVLAMGLSLLAASGEASAFTPVRRAAATRSGPELASGERARARRDVTATAPRAVLRAHAALSAQLGARDTMWDRDTGVPLRMWGAGMAAPGSVQSPAQAARAAHGLLAQHLAMLAPGSSVDDFVLVGNDLGSGIRSVGFAQRFAGRPVIGGQVSFRFKHDRLIAIGSEALPNISVELASQPIAAAEAQVRARAWIVADAAGSATAGAVEGPFILPVVVAGQKPRYHEVLRVTVEAAAPIGRFAVYLDAGTGRPIAREQLLHFASGTVQFRVPQRGPQGPRVDLPAPLLDVLVNGAASATDAAGKLTIPDGQNAAVLAGVAGAQAHIINDAGPTASKDLSLAPGGIALWADTSELIEAQLSAYAHIGVVKQRVRSIAPDFAYLDQDLSVTVNIASPCNASSDGDALSFFQSGDGCENTARLADVVYHEYGHSVHAQGLIPGVGTFDPALAEGVADYLASTITNDAGVARGYYVATPDEPLRQLDPQGDERRWPEDLDGTPHDDGLIISGALWDLRTLLIAKLGPTAGVALTDKIWFESIRRAIDIPTMYPEALVVDDDDGDLANGTPNECEINRAFAAHGLLGPIINLGASITVLEQTASGTPVRVSITGGARACVDLTLKSAELRVRKPGDDGFDTLPMSADQGGFLGLLPNFPDGTLIEYQVGVTFTDDSTAGFPQNPADPWYQLYFGPVTPLACTGFEVEPAAEGWQLGGQWQWGVPTGKAGDPLGPFAGGAALGVNLDGAYLPESSSVLASPTIATMGFPTVRLQYRRWLNVEVGFFDQATIRVNGEVAWQNRVMSIAGSYTGNHRDAEWRFHDVDISDLVNNDQVQLEFTLQSDAGYHIGGWTIDELCVVGTDQVPVGVCGNGVLDPGESCDGGPNNSDTLPDTCRTNCLPARCGDLVIDEGELCDDGGVVAGDGCGPTCQTEGPSTATDVPTTSAGDGETEGESSGLLPEDTLGDSGCACDARGPRDLHGLALGLLVLGGLRPRRRPRHG